MAVIKQSSISSRVVNSIDDICSNIGNPSRGSLFIASEIMGCHRKAILGKNSPFSHEQSHIKFRYAMYRSDLLQIIDEDMVFSCMEIGVECKVDMLARYAGEHVIISISSYDGDISFPLTGDIINMVAAMYSSGVWSGLIVYDVGNGYRVFFANPDRADAKKILAKMTDRGKLLHSYVMNNVIPEGEKGAHCSQCPYVKSCDELIIGVGNNVGNREREEAGD